MSYTVFPGKIPPLKGGFEWSNFKLLAIFFIKIKLIIRIYKIIKLFKLKSSFIVLLKDITQLKQLNKLIEYNFQ